MALKQKAELPPTCDAQEFAVEIDVGIAADALEAEEKLLAACHHVRRDGQRAAVPAIALEIVVAPILAIEVVPRVGYGDGLPWGVGVDIRASSGCGVESALMEGPILIKRDNGARRGRGLCLSKAGEGGQSEDEGDASQRCVRELSLRRLRANENGY